MFFGKRTAEIQKQSVNGVFVEKVVEIFRLSHAETQIGELEFYFRFRARYKNIRCFFDRDKVDVGVLPRKFNREDRRYANRKPRKFDHDERTFDNDEKPFKKPFAKKPFGAGKKEKGFGDRKPSGKTAENKKRFADKKPARKPFKPKA